jgi:hypothetical protein
VVVLAIWAAIVGYTLLYAGVVNWGGGALSIADAFTGGQPARSTPSPPSSSTSGSAEFIPVTPQPAPGQPANATLL